MEDKSFSDNFSVFVHRDKFKFTAAHFICYEGYRERLHGHNYTASVELFGTLCRDGYCIDFEIVKSIMTDLCRSLNQLVLVPMKSPVLKIVRKGLENSKEQVEIMCEDESFFSFPKQDCALLPVAHSSAEELSQYLLDKMLLEFEKRFGTTYLHDRMIRRIDISVAEMPNQYATCSRVFARSHDLNDNKQASVIATKPCLHENLMR